MYNYMLFVWMLCINFVAFSSQSHTEQAQSLSSPSYAPSHAIPSHTKSISSSSSSTGKSRSTHRYDKSMIERAVRQQRAQKHTNVSSHQHNRSSSSSSFHEGSDDRSDDDEIDEYASISSFNAGVNCSVVGSGLLIYGLMTTGLFISAPVVASAAFLTAGGLFFLNVPYEERIKQQIDQEIALLTAFTSQKIDTKNIVHSNYQKLPDYNHFLPTHGSGTLFIPAVAQDGRVLRDKHGAYYDTQGRKWTLNQSQDRWVITNSFNSNKIIVNIRHDDGPHHHNPQQPVNQDNAPVSMDAPPIEKLIEQGCGGKLDIEMPTVLIHPIPEPKKPEPLVFPIAEQEKPEPFTSPIPQVKPEDLIMHVDCNQAQEQIIEESFADTTVDESEAANANAQIYLDKKLRALQKAYDNAARIELLPDGRIRYYAKERLSLTSGPTRGSSYVTEYNKKTGQVRAWIECYDHEGNVNRVHPKSLNGQDLIAQHYPPTKSELESFEKNEGQ